MLLQHGSFLPEFCNDTGGHPFFIARTCHDLAQQYVQPILAIDHGSDR
jgi:hypothetical protein